MKNRQPDRPWNSLLLLVALAVLFRVVLAQPMSSFSANSVNAVVIVGGVSWSDPPGEDQDKNVPPRISVGSTCPIYATGRAYIESICMTEHVNTLEINTAGTGIKVEATTDERGNVTYELSEPENPGTVTFVATVTGDVWNPETEDCESVTYRAEGYLEVVDDGGGCASGSCGGSPPLASGTCRASSVDFRLQLGPASAAGDGGFVWLKADASSAALATPGALVMPYSREGVEVIRGAGQVIEQVKTPLGLIQVATIDSRRYHLDAYYQSQVTGKDSNGRWVHTGSPFVTWEVRNPNQGSDYNQLVVSEQRNGVNRDFQYTYTPASLRWDLVHPNGQTESAWKQRVVGDGTVTNYFTQIAVGNQVLRKTQNTYQYVAAIQNKILTQRVEGDSPSTQTTSYDYYTSGPAANRVRRVDAPEGRWVYYSYDSHGRLQGEYVGYTNSSPPPIGSAPTLSVNPYTLTTYSYSLTDAEDGTVYDGNTNGTPCKTIVKLPVKVGSNWDLYEVARTYRQVKDDVDTGEDTIQQCVNPGALWDDPTNLRTSTYRLTSGGHLAGKPTRVTRPDGSTVDYTYYPDSFQTIEQDSHGFTTVMITDELANPLSYVKSDTSTGIVLEQRLYSYQSGGSYVDPLRRSYSVTDLAGRATSYSYACCGLDTTTDADGATTQYHYDALKRQTATTAYAGPGNGVMLTNILDGAGRVLVSLRIGTDSTTHTLQQLQYDSLGRTVRTTNALNGVTSTDYLVSDSRLVKTITYPDLGTRVETYYRDGRLETLTGTAVAPVRYTYGVELDEDGRGREYLQEIKLDASGNPTSEWTKTYQDGLGRSYRTLYAASGSTLPYRQSWYNNAGQIWKERDPDGVFKLYKYNAAGEQEYTVIPVVGIDQTYGGGTYDALTYDEFYPPSHLLVNDRVSRTERTVQAAALGKPDLVRFDTRVWKTDDFGELGSLISRVETSTDGMRTWQISYRDASTPVTTTTTTLPGSSRTVTSTAPDGSSTVGAFSYGRLSSVTRRDSAPNPNQVVRTSYGYDTHGRQHQVIDARTGTTTYAFNSADLVTTLTTPPPASGQSPQVTFTYYDTSLRAWKTQLPDSSSTTNVFHPTGLLCRTSGSRTTPVGYGYDPQGRMTKMTNWTTFPTAGERITTWVYNQYRGWLEKKICPGETDNAADYDYKPSGRLFHRYWERGVSTTYSYGAAGELAGVDYSDSTPDVTYTYDRLGRQRTIVVGSMTTTLSYNDANQLLTEAYSGGVLSGKTVSSGYNSYLQRNSLAVNTASPLSYGYVYDSAGRLQTVTEGTYSAVYGYLANSPLVSQIAYKQGITTWMVTSKGYDFLNRLTTIASTPAAPLASPISSAYLYNSANQRTRQTLSDGSYWVYQYDRLGQVTSGKKYWSDGTLVAGQQFEYSFNEIGNREQTKAGGDASGANLRTALYSHNALNQLIDRDVPGAVDVFGIGNGAGTVTVNGQSTYRKSEYFRKELTVANTAGPVWQPVTVAATGATSTQGNAFVPQTKEVFDDPATTTVNEGYDADGNQIRDGRWTYSWDGENRLIRMVTRTAAGPPQRIDFEYDAKGRRIAKKVWNNTNGSGNPSLSVVFVYDGWNLVAELDALNGSAVKRSYLWGLDLSGSEQGAGGVGGLLKATTYSSPTIHSDYVVAYDGNGNVAGLVGAGDGVIAALLEYGPFGEPLRRTGTVAASIPIRFSSKYQDDESDLLYYGYRFYNPSTGRWPNRDPIGEPEFFKRYARGKSLEENLELAKKGLQAGYQFAGNDPITQIDILGLENVQIVVTSVIRPPDAQAGVKTIHSVVVNEYGQIVSSSTFTGTTRVPGGIGYPTGTSTFRHWVTGTHPSFTVTMIGNSHSALLPSFFDIDYNYDIHLNFCEKTGSLSGINDGYPSYTVRVKGKTVWDWQQQTLFSLLGDGEITASAEFNW